MNIIVCAKQVPDPETPQSALRVDSATNKMITPPGVSPVVNGFDEQAVEAALRIKDVTDTHITVITLGNGLVPEVVKKPLSMGADELMLLQDPIFDDGDSFTTAHALAAAIRKIGNYDLILCGRQASDWDAGQVGSGIATILNLPSVTFAKGVEVTDGKVRVERVLLDGFQVVEASLPALVTVSNELGEPRYPTLKGIMAAGKKQPTVWNAQDIGIDPSKTGKAGARSKLVKLFIPEKVSQCEFIEGETDQEKGTNLALKLREAKLI